MDKVWKEYKRQLSSSDLNAQTSVNTSMNANSLSDRGKELSEIMEELGIDMEENSHGVSGGLLRKDMDLNLYERKYLIAVELGDMNTVKNFIENAHVYNININCVDSLGRSAILIAIEYEHIETLEVLLGYNLELGDALLHAIQEENVIAVEMLLHVQAERQNVKKNLSSEHRSRNMPPTESFEELKKSEKGIFGAAPSSSFTPDVTPIILAAHIDNYEIIKILLDRGDRVPKPHEVRCACLDCERAHKEDSLRHSKSRINAYKALASPSLISLSSKDPILTAFELSWEMKRLGRMENEFKDEYERLSMKCQNYATALLEQTRSSEELAIILNHDIGQGSTSTSDIKKSEAEGEKLTLARLKLAIKYKQKKFVAHPHCQQLLAAIWYEGLPGFRRKHLIFQMIMIGNFASIFPFLSLVYLVAPRSSLGQTMRKPFIKFICHSASYLAFLGFLVLAALRIEDVITGTMTEKMKERGSGPSFIEIVIITYVVGFIWQEVKQLWVEGAKAYVTDMWNLLDFATNALYIATISLRAVAYYRVKYDGSLKNVHRKYWDAYDPTLISECLFATANIFSMLKLVYIFTVNPHLGPLQISLGRMLSDILKFFFIVILVLASFSCGLNQLYWFYAYERTSYCKDVKFFYDMTGVDLEKYQYCVTRGRLFSNLFEISQSLYWATYGLIDLSNTDLEYEHSFTQFVGKTMLGVYSYISIIVILNMLIAMMNNSYEFIAKQADMEWKFARSKLWISYFDEGGTLPVPFNVFPSPKSCYYLFMWMKDKMCSCSKKHQRNKWQSIRKVVKKVNEKEARYQAVMRDLIKRYLMQRQRANENQGVTEDDLNEIKADISAFRFELLSIFKNNGMKTPEYTEQRSTKLRRRGSKRTGNRMTKKFDAIVEEGVVAPANGKPGLNSTMSEPIISTSGSMGSSMDSNDSIPNISPHKIPPSYQKAATMPEITLNPSQLPGYPNTETENGSPFNKKAGAIKKVSFNWRQENETDASKIIGDPYVYQGTPQTEPLPEVKDEELPDPDDKPARRSDLV